MKKTIALIIAIFAITVLSCDKKTMPESGFPYTDHFVDVYTYMTRLNVGWPHVVEQDGFAHGDFVFNISIGWDAEIRGDELDAIHKQLGDNSRIRPGNRFSPRIATLNHFIKLTIVSDSDYNDIPAGSPLDAIIRVYGSTAYPVFKDLHCQADFYDQELKGTWEGYDKSLYINNKDDEVMFFLCNFFERSYYWYDKMVSELQPDDLFLLDRIMLLRITEKPSIKKHKLTITLEEEGGKTFSTSVDVEFPS